jgi:hypothetical protein
MTSGIPEDELRTPNGKKRALLDTNIWRYVVDSGSQGTLLRLASNGSYDVQIAPGVLYETLRLKDVALRATLVRLMTNFRFHRLLPEAYSESMEILREIERLRPDWPPVTGPSLLQSPQERLVEADRWILGQV